MPHPTPTPEASCLVTQRSPAPLAFCAHTSPTWTELLAGLRVAQGSDLVPGSPLPAPCRLSHLLPGNALPLESSHSGMGGRGLTPTCQRPVSLPTCFGPSVSPKLGGQERPSCLRLLKSPLLGTGPPPPGLCQWGLLLTSGAKLLHLNLSPITVWTRTLTTGVTGTCWRLSAGHPALIPVSGFLFCGGNSTPGPNPSSDTWGPTLSSRPGVGSGEGELAAKGRPPPMPVLMKINSGSLLPK